MPARPLFRRPAIFPSIDSLLAAESTRHGGVSPAPYASLNLGFHTPDDPAHVTENRRRFLAALGAAPQQLAESYQVHGREVLRVEKPGRYEGYDALITDRPGILLAVKTADCTPVLIFDPVRRAVAAVHAGWRGTTAEIVRHTLEKMRAHFGTDPADCLAYVGACIDECSYEVDADVAGHFDPAFKRWDAKRGKFFLDLKAANRTQLLAGGLPESSVEVSPRSTVLNNEDYFSHRHDKGKTGRQMAVIGLRDG